MRHVMFDLETMGNAPGCAIVSFGAVDFDPEKGVGTNTFYEVVDLQSCLDAGLKIDASTLYWWMGQSEAARKALLQPGKHITDVVGNFKDYWVRCGATFAWCHGATFDAPIVDLACRAVGTSVPWKFWDVRDTRTIFDLTGVTIPRAKGVHHNALDDAKNQAAAVCEAYRRLRKTATPAAADMLG